MTRSILSLIAALLIVACEDTTGPEEATPLPSPDRVAASAAGSFTTDAVLSGNLVTPGHPITYRVNFGRRFRSISRVVFLFRFGDDPLDPNDCLLFFPSDASGGGSGVCNPGPAAQTSRELHFPCATHAELGCDPFRDGVSAGEFTVEELFLRNLPVSVSLRSVTVTIEGESALTVSIDIKPGDSKNSINPASRGLIAVAILSTTTFNATGIDPLSVRFGPSGATEAHGRGHLKDVDGDGDRDLLLHFRTSATGIKCGDSFAGVTGATVRGETFGSSDAVRTVGCRPRWP